jgi:hypothetical protein
VLFPFFITKENDMSDLTDFQKQQRYIIIGRRFGCDVVAVEATEAAARWARDQVALARYGFGADMRAKFEVDRQSHDGLRIGRSVAVAQKKTSYATRDEKVSRGWAWVDQVTSMLGVLALAEPSDSGLAHKIAAAKPEDDANLEAGIAALAEILASQKDKLSPECQVDQRLAEAKELAAAVATLPGVVHTSRSQTMADTAELDALDGKLYTWLIELNRAARRAIRNGHLKASRQEYTLHHLKRSGSPVQPPVTVTPQPPAPSPAG